MNIKKFLTLIALILTIIFFEKEKILNFCIPENKTPVLIHIKKHNYWIDKSYQFTIYEKGKVYLSYGKFFKRDEKGIFQINEDIIKKIQNSIQEIILSKKKGKKDDEPPTYNFCSDCITIEIDYHIGFEHEKIILYDSINLKDFEKLNEDLIKFERILGIK